MEYAQFDMIRPTLDGVPQCLLPQGFGLRYFRPGDETTWVRIWQAAEEATGLSQITLDNFTSSFGGDLPGMEQRCLFLVAPDGEDVGTTTAWYDHRFKGGSWGRIHWVALLPHWQGKGLSKPMLSAALNRMRELGHGRAMLTTHTRRLVAIRLYLSFGFQPDLDTPDGRRAWDMVRAALPGVS